MKYKYATKSGEENSAKVVGRALPISTKQAVEVCRLIRDKNLQNAKKILDEVINKKKVVPYLRYYKGVGHKRGKVASGRFPKKTCSEILTLLKSIEANAQLKGLGTSNLFITHICAHKASRPWHYGRQRRIKMKRSHVEIIVNEKKDVKKEGKMKEIKGEVTKEEVKKNIKSDEKIGKEQKSKQGEKND